MDLGQVVQICPSTNYERTLLASAFKRLGLVVVDEEHDTADPAVALLWAKPRDINWARVLDGSLVVSGYLLTSALTRKADLARCLHRHRKAYPHSPAAHAMPQTFVLDADEYESEEDWQEGELAAAWRAVEADGGLWLLKASDSNRGENIFVLEATPAGRQQAEAILRKTLGAWVLQQYVPNLLLLDGRKCHLRVHVLAVGDLRIYTHSNSLVLPAAQRFNTDAGGLGNPLVHATNYAVQKRHSRSGPVARSLLLTDACAAWAEDEELALSAKEMHRQISRQLEDIVCDLFQAAVAYRPGLFPLANCFQLFGLDFMLDRDLCLHLLEVNCDPSLSIFGEHHTAACQQLLDDTVALACSLLLPRSTPMCQTLSQARAEMTAESGAGQPVLPGTGYTLVLDRAPRCEANEGRAVLSRLMRNMGTLTAATYDPPSVSTQPDSSTASGSLGSEVSHAQASTDTMAHAPHSSHGADTHQASAATAAHGCATPHTSDQPGVWQATGVSLAPPKTTPHDTGADHAGPQANQHRHKCCISPGIPYSAELAQHLRAAGWEVTHDAREPLCELQLADHADVRWDRVLDGSLAANHYYNRRCLIGSPARLAQLYLLVHRQQAQLDQHQPAQQQQQQQKGGNKVDQAAARPPSVQPDGVTGGNTDENCSAASNHALSTAEAPSPTTVSGGSAPAGDQTQHVLRMPCTFTVSAASLRHPARMTQLRSVLEGSDWHLARLPVAEPATQGQLAYARLTGEQVLHHLQASLEGQQPPQEEGFLLQQCVPQPLVSKGHPVELTVFAVAVGSLQVFMHSLMVVSQSTATQDATQTHSCGAMEAGNKDVHAGSSPASSPEATTGRQANASGAAEDLAGPSTMHTQTCLCRCDHPAMESVRQLLGGERVQERLRQSVSALFRVAKGSPAGFLPFRRCFELFRVRFAIDAHGEPWLLSCQPMSDGALANPTCCAILRASGGKQASSSHDEHMALQHVARQVQLESLAVALPTLGLGNLATAGNSHAAGSFVAV